MKNSNKLRVLWLTNLPAPYRFPIWTRMAKLLDCKVAFLLKKNNWRNWDVPSNVSWKFEYLSLSSRKFGDFDLIPSIRGAKKILRNIDVMILGGWESPFYLWSLVLAKQSSIPVIQFYESTINSHRFNNYFIKKIRSLVLSSSDLVVTIGNSSRKAVEAMGVSSKKIMTLFNPADVEWFHSFAENHRGSTNLGHRYIYVGQLIERKNVATIIKSFAEIKSELDTLQIVGRGPLEQSLQKLVSDLNVSESVTFLGQKDQVDLGKLYASSNTLILASSNEVWGLVVNEALAAGLHVVVSKQCGVAEFISGMEGAFIAQGDLESIKYAMRKSAEMWDGYILNPEILKYTPEKFADEIALLCQTVFLGKLK